MKRKEAAFSHDLGDGSRVTEKVRKFENMSKNVTTFVERDDNEAHRSTNSSLRYIGDRTPSTPYETQGQLQLRDPVDLDTIQSPFGSAKKELYSVLCVGRETLGITGRDNKNYQIYQIDRKGSTLNSFTAQREIRALSVNMQQELICAFSGSQSKIYKIKEGKSEEMLDLHAWEPFGLSCTQSNDLLVSMRCRNEARVVIYSGATKKQVIPDVFHKKPLFSSGNDLLALTENGNGDICVADYGGECVVVVDASGRLRFKYRGNVYRNSDKKRFLPRHIATDDNHQIIVNDFSEDIVHVIDRDGSLMCYIKSSCNGGLCIDPEHHLLVGDYHTGEIKVIKYLQE